MVDGRVRSHPAHCDGAHKINKLRLRVAGYMDEAVNEEDGKEQLKSEVAGLEDDVSKFLASFPTEVLVSHLQRRIDDGQLDTATDGGGKHRKVDAHTQSGKASTEETGMDDGAATSEGTASNASADSEGPGI